MTTKLETRLDEEFESMGVKVYIYHFRDVYRFRAISIATDVKQDAGALFQLVLRLNYRRHIEELNTSIDAPATWTRKELARHGFHGVAICDRRDQFSRKRGRIIAKGRLLKWMLRQEEQDYQQEVYAQIEYENRDIEED